MSKQFAAFHVSWRGSKKRPLMFGSDEDFSRAGASALEAKLNELAEEGWIVDRIIQAPGLTSRQTSAYTIVAFK